MNGALWLEPSPSCCPAVNTASASVSSLSISIIFFFFFFFAWSYIVPCPFFWGFCALFDLHNGLLTSTSKACVYFHAVAENENGEIIID